MIEFGNLYLGNKMQDRPFFNAPWFDATAERLRKVKGVTSVFNPAEEDRKHGFDPMSCPNGSAEEAASHGFNRRTTLLLDTRWIGENSNGLVVGPDWEISTGTILEVAYHQAMGLPVWEAHAFFSCADRGKYDWLLSPDWQVPQLGRFLG